MTTMTLDADFLRNLSIIAEEESLMQRASKYLRRLAAEKQKNDSLMTKEAFFAKIDRSVQQARSGQVSTINNKEELAGFLETL